MRDNIRWHFGLIVGWLVWVQGETVGFAIKLAGFVVASILVFWAMRLFSWALDRFWPEPQRR